ncbi:LD-carboxypeptidase [Flavobacteriaceae bacterium Ap0902]|nr:LD-carboxypeptidase [Flavobacteriaceae bacterium Ap0902]
MYFNKLKKGSKIAIAAPAGRIYPADLDFAISWIEENGWQAIFSEEIFRHYDFGYAYAGTDAHRRDQLQQYLDDSTIDAVWFARGGYGSAKIIDALDFSRFIENPKWLIGYSDITVFHNHLNNLGVPTLHAVTAKQLDSRYSQETYDSLTTVLKGHALEYNIPSTMNNIVGETDGTLVGGNLSIIYSLLGSESFIQGQNLILFIEDWQENWYHLDRMLTALKRAGLFKRVKGMVVGSFTKMDVQEENPFYSNTFDDLSNNIVQSFVEELHIPVAFNFPAGHIGDNRALILGAEVSLNIMSHRTKLSWHS